MSTISSSIVCRSPRILERFRVHPGGEREAATWLAYDPDTGEPHLVAQHLWQDTAGLVPACLRVCVNDNGERFVWCIEVRLLSESDSMPNVELMMAGTAEHLWCIPRNVGGSYEVLAPGEIPEPAWGEFNFIDTLQEAFRDRVVTSNNHPFITITKR